jgi:hypothetical protein
MLTQGSRSVLAHLRDTLLHLAVVLLEGLKNGLLDLDDAFCNMAHARIAS